MGTKALSDYMIEGVLHTGSIGNTIGDLKFNERYIAISTTHPWKNLADADEELDIANYPDYVPVMRNVIVRLSTSGGAYNSVVSEVIASNIVTLTIGSFSQLLLNAASEMVLDYTKGVAPTPTDYINLNLCINLITAIGSVPAGDYTITNINPSARTVSFNYIHPDESNSGLVGKYITFRPYRVPGDSTKCRHRQQLGKSIMTPDFETFFNGVSWRDHFQGHAHVPSGATGFVVAPSGTGGNAAAGTVFVGGTITAQSKTGDPTTDGTNGTPRTDSETYPSGLGAFLYEFVGRYIP